MRVGELPAAVLAGRLRNGQLLLPMGPYVVRLQSPLPDVAAAIGRAYQHHAALPHDGFADVQLQLRPGRGLRHWLAPTVEVLADGAVLGRSARQQAPLLLEQAIDAWLSHHAQPWMAVRIAAVARQGMALLLASRSGEGGGDPLDTSSQWLARRLCSALLDAGWRLLGEAVVLYDPDSGLLHGLPRPLRQQAAEAGAPALLPPPIDSVLRAEEPAWPTWFVLVEGASNPKPGSSGESPAAAPDAGRLEAYGASAAFMALAARTSRWAPSGSQGVRALGSLIDQCSCHRLYLSDPAHLAKALARLQHLTREAPCDGVVPP